MNHFLPKLEAPVDRVFLLCCVGEDVGCVRAEKGCSLLVLVPGLFGFLTTIGLLVKSLVHDDFGFCFIAVA